MPIRDGKHVNWRVKVKGIRSLIRNSSENDFKKVAKEIYKILTSDRYKKYFKDFENSWNCLEDFNWIEDVEELDELLRNLYDYADSKLIWIE